LVCSGDGETYIMSNEVMEVRYPIVVEQYALNVGDGSGKGKFRGGFGVVKDYRINNSNASFTSSMGRSLYPCWGINGGGNGTPNYFVIEKANQGPRRLRKVAAESMQLGDLVRLKTGGGGGFGNPMERDPERVMSDVINGYVSAEQAKSDYGVVIDNARMMVDAKATEELRANSAR
ncbi:MAG TPA: hydantoinase B/oxoprolinase family protein, partial [Nitrososphaerales archaeon]|nr:hydantoinase B/oxoprolinase family protein [Nitrososphaerales archaeon]